MSNGARKVETVGVSPKAVFATLAAVVSYLVVQEVVDFPAYVDLILVTLSVAIAAISASPGEVEPV